MRKKSLILFLLFALLFTGLPFSYAEAPDDIYISKVYGASDDGYGSHSFIELYNPNDEEVGLDAYSVQYRSSADGKHNDRWYKADLKGTIPGKGHYLIRAGAVSDRDNVKLDVPEGDLEWDLQLHNKGLTVVLMNNQDLLTESVKGNLENDRPEGLVDMVYMAGNDYKGGGSDDPEFSQVPPAYVGDEFLSLKGKQSKKKGVVRSGPEDTGTVVNYSKDVKPEYLPTNSGKIPEDDPEEPETPEYLPKTEGYYNGTADLNLNLLGRYTSGTQNEDGGVMEIVAYNEKTGYAYSVNGVDGVLTAIDVKDLKNPGEFKTLQGKNLNIKALIQKEGFRYGDMTSVAVSPDGTHVAVAIQDAGYNKKGLVAVFAAKEDGKLTLETTYSVGIQPDMVTYTPDGSKILTADEGEPRQGYQGEDPAGTVTVIDVKRDRVKTIGFENFDNRIDELIENNILLGKVDGVVQKPSLDLEPEYIALTNSTAYVSLQEANAIGILDLKTLEFTDICSVGFEDYGKVAADLVKDGKAELKTYPGIIGARMPDGISMVTVGGTDYLLTANEGDGREWGDYDNELKKKIDPKGKKSRFLNPDLVAGLPEGKDVMFGGRTFTMFKVTSKGLEEVFTSGSDFERITLEKQGDYFNVSNDDLKPDSRSGKKGPEPESVITGTVNGRTYAFVALERVGGIMVYDITDPGHVAFVNYINSRDYNTPIGTDNSPEGMAFMPDKDILLVSFEVSGDVAAYGLVSNLPKDDDDDKPVIDDDDEKDDESETDKPERDDRKPERHHSGDSSSRSKSGTATTVVKPAGKKKVKTLSNPFTDVTEKDWFYNDVMYVLTHELMNGTDKNQFGPQLPMTRGMLVTVLYRQEGKPEVKSDSNFIDVKDGSYYEDPIIWAFENDIVKGYDDKNFGPDDPITREQMVTILYRYGQRTGRDMTEKGSLDAFKDRDKVSDYALDPMKWAVGEGIIQGTDEGNLNPRGKAVRAEVAAILHRYLEN